MELAIAPPATVAAGVRLETPLVVTFTTATTAAGHGKTAPLEPISLPELSGVWALLTLTTPDMQESLVPPRTDLLTGRLSGSIHPVDRDQGTDYPTIAYATFPELVITQPGRYRIKIIVIDMNNWVNAPEQQPGTVLGTLHSPVFDVVEGQEHQGRAPKLAETVSRLRSIGVNC